MNQAMTILSFPSTRAARYAPRVETEKTKRPIVQDAEEDLRPVLDAIVRRDQTAFARLYDLTSGRVYGLALRILGRRDAAEEVVSDAYLQIWQQAARYDASRGVPLAWMLTIARSRALDYLRRRDEAQPHPDPTVLQPEAVTTESAMDILIALDNASALHDAIATLPSNARQLLGLAFFRGLSHQEIATHTGMPLGTVKTILRNALQALRPCLVDKSIGLEEFG